MFMKYKDENNLVQEREQMIFVIQIYFLFLPKIMLPATKSSWIKLYSLTLAL